MTLTIGNVQIPNPYILAPMAGVTDLPFRLLCKEMGAGLLCTEMISAKAITFHNKNTRTLMEMEKEEHPISLQLFGSDPDIMAEAAAQIEEQPFDILDINMGCPVPKVFGNGEGSALMGRPKLSGRIVEKLADTTKKPVTVKIRKGIDEDHVNAVEFAKAMEAAGAAAVAVHGRTRTQYYAGQADWGVIRQVKEAVKIPVIGNGDVTSPEDAWRMLTETGCDGVMIGRASRGNPWIFQRLLAFDQGERMPEHPSSEELRAMILRHAGLLVQYKGEYTGMREMRKHLAWYTAGYPHSAAIRRKACEIESMEQLEEIVKILTAEGS